MRYGGWPEQMMVPPMVAATRHFTYTTDPRDPCAYCVQWEWPEGVDQNDDPFMTHMIPMMPTYCVLRVYRGVHRKCDEAVADYVNESRD